MTTVYNPRSTVIRGVEKNHTARTLHDLDATAKLRLVKDGSNSTAHWTFAGGVHTIQLNTQMVSLIENPTMLKNPMHRRKELQYLRAVHNHEVAHGLYTSRDFELMNAWCKKNDIAFRDINLFEDARIEGFFRQRRPFKTAKKWDLDHKGAAVQPETYGVRKFEWLKWENLHIDTPRNAMLSIAKCEGTKKHLDELREMWVDRFGGLMNGFPDAKGKIATWHWFFAMWRDVAGRNADKRFPTTEALLKVVKMFNARFPYDPKRDGPPINGGGGNDMVDSAKEALGDKPHEPGGSGGGTPPPPPKEEKIKPPNPKGEVKGVTDKKRDSSDESKEKVTIKTILEHGLDPAYFAWEE